MVSYDNMTIHYFVVEQTATGKRTDSEPAMEKVNAFSTQRYIIDDTDTVRFAIEKIIFPTTQSHKCTFELFLQN